MCAENIITVASPEKKYIFRTNRAKVHIKGLKFNVKQVLKDKYSTVRGYRH